MQDIKYYIGKLLKWVLPILSIVTLQTLIKFTQLHILYWPDENDLFKHEYNLLFGSLIMFIIAIYYKFKVSVVISFTSIVLALVNIVGFSVATVLYYREIYLDKFI